MSPDLACDWCGEAVESNGRDWVSAKSRSLKCEASEDGEHEVERLSVPGKPRSEWDASDYLSEVVCRTIGCRSVFARWFTWPHSRVCTPFVWWLIDRDERKASA